jgi:hypothetical protein
MAGIRPSVLAGDARDDVTSLQIEWGIGDEAGFPVETCNCASKGFRIGIPVPPLAWQDVGRWAGRSL